MSRIGSVALAVVIFLAAVPPTRGQLDPFAFSAIGSFSAGSGSVVFNTDTLTVTGPGLSGSGVAFNQPGGPTVAVFNFSSFLATGSTTVAVTGSKPFALLSQGAATVPTINVSSSGPAFASTRPAGLQTRASSAAARGRSTNMVTASASTQSKLPSA